MGKDAFGELAQGDLWDSAFPGHVKFELLDWTRPFNDVFGDWLWERRDRLPGMLVIVPTAQSGRRLRQGLAERGGALAPRVRTSGFFLQCGEGAPESVEILAWVEVLEDISDWSAFSEAFPNPPVGEGSGWALGLAKSLAEVRAALLPSGLTMRQAAMRMRGTVDQGRWHDLARLEKQVEELLQDWGRKSRIRLLQEGNFH